MRTSLPATFHPFFFHLPLNTFLHSLDFIGILACAIPFDKVRVQFIERVAP